MNKPSTSKKSRYSQGIYIPRHPEKYAGKTGEKISYRSSWEKRCMEWFDDNPSIVMWNSEDFVIQYLSPLDNKVHRYFIDFLAKMKTKDGSLRNYAIEVKPYKETIPPTTRNKTRLITETSTYLVNQAKWHAAREFCASRDITFIVLNEYDLGIKQRPKQ